MTSFDFGRFLLRWSKSLCPNHHPIFQHQRFGNRCHIHIIFIALYYKNQHKKILLCDKHQLTVGHGNGKAEGDTFSDRDTVIISQHEVIFFFTFIHSFKSHCHYIMIIIIITTIFAVVIVIVIVMVNMVSIIFLTGGPPWAQPCSLPSSFCSRKYLKCCLDGECLLLFKSQHMNTCFRIFCRNYNFLQIPGDFRRRNPQSGGRLGNRSSFR